MTKELFNKLACPYDRHAPLTLRIFRSEAGMTAEGLLECPACGRYYPIIGGVPVMAPDEYRDASLEANFLDKWSAHLGSRYGSGEGFRLAKEVNSEE